MFGISTYEFSESTIGGWEFAAEANYGDKVIRKFIPEEAKTFDRDPFVWTFCYETKPSFDSKRLTGRGIRAFFVEKRTTTKYLAIHLKPVLAVLAAAGGLWLAARTWSSF